MSIFEIYDLAQNGLRTNRQQMEITSQNVANMLTPGYKAKHAVVSSAVDSPTFSKVLAGLNHDDGVSSLVKGNHKGMGTQVAAIIEDKSQGVMVYLPGHPLADENGNVEMANVDGNKEMLIMMDAVRQYKANLSIMEMAKKAQQEAMNMTKNA